jgi:hypothetical protein
MRRKKNDEKYRLKYIPLKGPNYFNRILVYTELVAHCLPPSLQFHIPRLGSAYLKTTLNGSAYASQNTQKTCSNLDYKISCSQKATVAKNTKHNVNEQNVFTRLYFAARHTINTPWNLVMYSTVSFNNSQQWTRQEETLDLRTEELSKHGEKRQTPLEMWWHTVTHGWGSERGNWRMEWVASTLHTTSEHGLPSIPTADAHTSAASSRLSWRPRRFKWTRPFRRKTISCFYACAISFQLASNFLNCI